MSLDRFHDNCCQPPSFTYCLRLSSFTWSSPAWEELFFCWLLIAGVLLVDKTHSPLSFSPAFLNHRLSESLVFLIVDLSTLFNDLPQTKCGTGSNAVIPSFFSGHIFGLRSFPYSLVFGLVIQKLIPFFSTSGSSSPFLEQHFLPFAGC